MHWYREFTYLFFHMLINKQLVYVKKTKQQTNKKFNLNLLKVSSDTKTKFHHLVYDTNQIHNMKFLFYINKPNVLYFGKTI